jgi:hypothetical protein
MQRGMLLSLLAAAALLAAGQANAAQSGAAMACVKDYRQFCKSVPTGGGRSVACLKEHAAELSAPCKEQVQVLEACAPEIKKLCGEGAGAGELRTCLKAHASELSADCKAAGAGRAAGG